MRYAAAPALALIALAAGTDSLGLPLARAADPAGIEFFEKKIRPVLVEQCYACHSTEAEKNNKLKASLYLDSRDGLLTGGDGGAVIVPGKPTQSVLIETLRYDGDVKMPPKGKLPAAVVADFEQWVAMGAPDPRAGEIVRKTTGLSIAEGRQFWSYRPLQQPPVPVVKDTTWPVNDIDRFILARLEAEGHEPAAEADRMTLVRRLYYDLWGLPPPPEAVENFVNDMSSDAYDKLVDRLLASPHFGERWGRHWLDVARYAESLTLRGFVLKEAWRYRDYVIDAFNSDMPFDQFIREQIAGDLLPAATTADRRRQIIATAFLVLGNTNLEEQDKKQLRMDVVDEQLDVISKGFLAQTITCARCHDHKFDPIPTKDYYALAGILRNTKSMEHANVSKWIEVPLPAEPEIEAAIAEHEKAIATLQERIKNAKAKAGTAVGVLAVQDIPGIVVDDTEAKKVGTWQNSTHSGTYIGSGYTHDQNTGKGEKTLTFQPELPETGRYEVRLAYSHGSSRAINVPVTIFSADGEKTIIVDMKKPPPIDGRFVSLGTYLFEKDGQSFVIISNEGTAGHVTADAVTFISANTAATPKSTTAAVDELQKLEVELKRLQQQGPKREMAMSILEEETIEDTRVHIRGNVHTLGESAPRGFLQVATYGSPLLISPYQSGRKELADWIASTENPLTARVFVNRVWHWLFGDGIVRTVDNFGTTGEAPSHPELLDHLAARFIAEGWSIKQLVRSIVQSRTYRQAVTRESPIIADPENRLFARANRRRMDAESIRDTILAVSGKLSLERGGPTFPLPLATDYGYKHTDTRRSVYAPVFRNALPDLFEAFDFADPSMTTGRRTVSTAATQALLMMNHPFVLEHAKHAANRILSEDHPDNEARVVWAYRLTLGRKPTAGELEIARKFLSGRDPAQAWSTLFQALFASADFRYVN